MFRDIVARDSVSIEAMDRGGTVARYTMARGGIIGRDRGGTMGGDTLARDRGGTIARDRGGTMDGGTMAGDTLARDRGSTMARDRKGTMAGNTVASDTLARDRGGTMARNRGGTMAGGKGGSVSRDTMEIGRTYSTGSTSHWNWYRSTNSRHADGYGELVALV